MLDDLKKDFKKRAVEALANKAIELIVLFLSLVVLPLLLRYVLPRGTKTISVSLPLWGVLSILVALAAIIYVMVIALRRSHRKTLAKLASERALAVSSLNTNVEERGRTETAMQKQIDELATELARFRRPFFPFKLFDLLWEIEGVFPQVFRNQVSALNVQAIVNGPLCPKCHEQLSQRVGRGVAHPGDTGLLMLIVPCPKCAYQPSRSLILDVEILKVEVLKEAQRLARRGEFPREAPQTTHRAPTEA